MIPGRVPLEITYSITVNDLAAFQEYHNQQLRGKDLIGPWKRLVIVWTLLGGMAALTTWHNGRVGGEVSLRFILTWLTLAAIAAIAILRPRRMLVWFIKYGLGDRYRTRIGLPRRVELNADYVACATPESTTITRWSAIEKVASTPDYLFIYESPHPTEWHATTWNALAGQIAIVPRDAFENDDLFREYIETANFLYEQTRAQQSTQHTGLTK
jgi:hypothetical protein